MPPSSSRVINALLILGAIVLALACAIVVFLPLMLGKGKFPGGLPYIHPGLTPTAETLGDIGTRCGGPERYPCGPGSTCSVPMAQWETTYGTCTATNEPPPSEFGPQ